MRALYAGLVGAAIALAVASLASAEGGPPVAGTPADRLAAVDQVFFASYERAVREVISSGPPAFLVLPERLVLYRQGARHEWPLIPPLFNELKTVAHVTLGLFAVLSPSNGEPLGTSLAALRQYQHEIATARAVIDSVPLSAEQRDRQEQILTASEQLASRALAARRIAPAELTEFCRRVRPWIDANIREAVAAYLDGLNKDMTAALQTLSPTERGEYLVIVTGVHQARIDNAAMQYFNRLLRDPPTIAQRVMYAENVFDEAGALHLLGIHLMARRVGVAYFDDPFYMNRDLFAPAAAAYVPTMTLPVTQ